jgi:hypothetical protein
MKPGGPFRSISRESSSGSRSRCIERLSRGGLDLALAWTVEKFDQLAPIAARLDSARHLSLRIREQR